jgi:Cupredoxin-like domain
MKRSAFNLQTIVLISVLSAAVLFGMIFSPHGYYYTQMADAQGSSGVTTSDATTKTLATQQQPMKNAIQLSAKEEPSGYRWVDTTSGVINPTLNLNTGTNKAIQLQNPTDAKHQLIIDDLNRKQLETSGDIASGSSRQLSFTPGISGTFQYHYLYHQTKMKGTIQVQ